MWDLPSTHSVPSLALQFSVSLFYWLLLMKRKAIDMLLITAHVEKGYWYKKKRLYYYFLLNYSKESSCSVGDLGLIPGLGRSPGEGHGNPLQYPCLENPMDRGASWPTVCGVTNSRIRLSDFQFTLHSWFTMIQVHSKIMHLYIYVDIYFQILFHYRFLQDTVYSSLWCTVGNWSLLHTAVCAC